MSEIPQKRANNSTGKEPNEGEDEDRCDTEDAEDGQLGEEDGDVTGEVEISGDVRVGMFSCGRFHLLLPFSLAHSPATCGVNRDGLRF